MTNENGLCCDCERKEKCNMHKKNPQVKVVDCQQFSMNEKTKEIYKAIAMFAVGGCDDD